MSNQQPYPRVIIENPDLLPRDFRETLQTLSQHALIDLVEQPYIEMPPLDERAVEWVPDPETGQDISIVTPDSVRSYFGTSTIREFKSTIIKRQDVLKTVSLILSASQDWSKQPSQAWVQDSVLRLPSKYAPSTLSANTVSVGILADKFVSVANNGRLQKIPHISTIGANSLRLFSEMIQLQTPYEQPMLF